MRHPRLVNLLDDFALGGVSRALGIFDCAAVRDVVAPSVAAIDRNALIAPRLDSDIIVTHFPANWRRLMFLATLKLRNPQARLIHVEHSYTRSWEQHNVTHRRRFRTMLQLAFRLVDQVVCVSASQARWLEGATRLSARKIEVIHPYSANAGIGALAPRTFDTPRTLRIGAYGRFHEAKGFDTLISAWKAGGLPGTELLIGGFGPDESRLRALAGDAPGITFAGKVDDVCGFLQQCDIIAVPSNWESYGLVASEAREAGRPIMVSDVDGLPEQVGEAGLVVDFSDHAALRATVLSLTGERLTAMSRAGRRATHNCGLIRQQQWADLLRRLLRYPAGPAPRYGSA